MREVIERVRNSFKLIMSFCGSVHAQQSLTGPCIDMSDRLNAKAKMKGDSLH